MSSNSKKISAYSYWGLALVLILGVYLRLTGLKAADNFLFSDLGRYLLVAKKMAGGGPVMVAPHSTWLMLPNTPFFHWLIAGWYKVFNSFEAVLIIHALLSSLLILVSFLIGFDLGGSWWGLMLSSMTAFSAVMVNYSRRLSQFSLLPLFLGISFYCYLKAKGNCLKDKRDKWIFLSMLFFLPALVLHNSVFLVVPGFFYLWLRGGSKIKVAGLMLMELGLFILLAYKTKLFLVKQTLMELLRFNNLSFQLERGDKILAFFFSSLGLGQWMGWYLLGLMIIIIILGYQKKIKVEDRSLLKDYLIIMASVLWLLLLPIKELYVHYFSAVMVFVLWLIVLLHYLLPGKIKYLLSGGFLLVFSFLSIGEIEGENRRLSYTLEEGYKVARVIKQSQLDQQNLGFEILMPLRKYYQLPGLSNWFTGGVWDCLEEISNKDYVRVVDANLSANNTMLLNSKVSGYILICIRNEGSDYLKLDNCFLDWQELYGGKLEFVGKVRGSGYDYFIYQSRLDDEL